MTYVSKAEKAIYEAVFENYSIEELKTGEQKTVMMQDFDCDYWNFILSIQHDDKIQKAPYFTVELFVCTSDIYPDAIPLMMVSSVLDSPDEMVRRMAEAMEKTLDLMR